MEKYFHRVDRGNNNETCVVFVHGVFGHYRETWCEFPHLLTQDSELNHCDWICWGYPSNLRIPKYSWIPFLGNRMPSLESVSEALCADLKNPQIGGNYRNLVLVGHSMGGLVLMKMIISALTQAEEDVALLDRIRHVVLYATPSDGVQLPRIFRVHPQARSIAANEAFVTAIRNEWINRIYTVRPDSPRQPGKRYIPLIAVLGLQDNAVPSESAASYYSDVVKVQGNHLEMCKPESRESTAFQALKRAIISSMKLPDSDATIARTVLSAPEKESAETGSAKIDAVEEEKVDDLGWMEMAKGNFNEAYRVFKQEFTEGTIDVEYFALVTHMLYQKGWTEGFSRLKQLVIENPDNAHVAFYLALAYRRTGEIEKAITILRKFRDSAVEISDKLSRTVDLAAWLVEADKSEEALNELRHGLEQAEDPPDKSAIYKGLGDTLIKIRKSEPLFGIACYERALALQLMDESLRFNLAYTQYSKLAPAVAFYHYRQCPTNQFALNNAGVEAERLKLPITSIENYTKAAEQSNTLSMANIASRLLEAGFAEQAKETLEKARQKPDYHQNVDLNLATLQRRRNSESEEIKKVDEKVKRIVSWRSLEADAIGQPQFNLAGLTGEYEAANGATLKITCHDGRTIVGESTTTKETLRFTGYVEGELVRLNWNTTPLETAIPAAMGAGLLGLGLGTPTADKGIGSLIIKLNGLVLTGYRTKADDPLVPIDWELSRKLTSLNA